MALFNRALVYEKLFQFRDAAEDWRNYLSLDSHEPWAKEARQHLDAVQRKIDQHDRGYLHFRDGPEAFLAALRSGHPPSLDLYLSQAVIEWLARPSERAATDAAHQLAQRLATEHRDRWLLQLLEETPPGDQAYSRLLNLINANIAGTRRMPCSLRGQRWHFWKRMAPEQLLCVRALS
jgi:hypothetical protein